jgi:hypothetical protein
MHLGRSARPQPTATATLATPHVVPERALTPFLAQLPPEHHSLAPLHSFLAPCAPVLALTHAHDRRPLTGD